VMENLEHALEYSPESFGRVTMLYIPVEVNGTSLKAFVDSGAQQTIMSPDCAEKCGIMRLLDRRFAGVARGVGTAAILGRVHSAQMKVADLHLACSFTIMEGRDVDLLFGLDMLKAHQACIDLEKGVLRIRGREVAFLSEHELPEQAKLLEAPIDSQPAPGSGAGPSSAVGHAPSGSPSAREQFPGTGNTVGSQQPRGTQNTPVNARGHAEQDILTVMNLGVTRDAAIELLNAAGGNVEIAAAMLFQ